MSLLLAVPMVPLQMVVGDWSAKVVAKSQPVKFAAMEGQFETRSNAPLHIGGFPNEKTREMQYSIQIPSLLSWIAYGDFNAEVKGLNDFPPADTPPVAIVHFAFQTMVGIGSFMMLVALWCVVSYWRTRAWPKSKLFLRSIVVLGPLSIIALLSGWVVTEVGRQPWIVQGYMRTSEAVTQATGVWQVFGITMAIYFLLGVTTVVILRQLAKVPLGENENGA